MQKLTTKHQAAHRRNGASRVLKLTQQRRKVAGRLAKLDRQIEMTARLTVIRTPTSAAIDRWFNKLSEGLESLPPLPADFSRADIYNDHD